MPETRPKLTASDIERFWSRVERCEPDACWPWLRGTNKEGYGTFRTPGHRMHRAPRVAYELLIGPIPEGLELDHLCRNRLCVNPAHLEPVTHAENVRRGASPSAINARKTHCKRGHPLSGDNLTVCADGKRVCRTCHRAREARRYREKRNREITPAGRQALRRDGDGD